MSQNPSQTTISPQGDLFHFDENRPSFEDYVHENGFLFWYASDVSVMMGYASPQGFEKALNRAIGTCTTLSIPVEENFIRVSREVDGKMQPDCKLSKFACYLVAMNGDTSKPAVAHAQVYFATIAASFQKYVREVEDVERVAIREELSDHEKSLSGVANNAGIAGSYGIFKDAGYRGMYNMSLRSLKARRGIPEGRTPLDFMGKTELAGNLFRLTQTEEKIQNEKITGERHLISTAKAVGKKVREAMIEIGGTAPESLPMSSDIRDVKKDLKATRRGLLPKQKKTKPKQIP